MGDGLERGGLLQTTVTQCLLGFVGELSSL
jgi:hypothetical protein